MGLHVLEIHHHAIRIDPEPQQLNAVQSFSKDVLGLDTDPGRPTIPGVPGFWINVGQCRIATEPSLERGWPIEE